MSDISMAGHDWHHRDEWTANTYSNVCRVQVSRHQKHDGNGWAVYALIFPEHPLFATLLAAWNKETPYYDIPEISAMPLHCGCSYFQAIACDTITSFKIGADYSHLHDDYYLRQESPDCASSVFHDAAELLRHLLALCPASVQ